MFTKIANTANSIFVRNFEAILIYKGCLDTLTSKYECGLSPWIWSGNQNSRSRAV